MEGREQVLLAVSPDELPPRRRVWGRENRSLPSDAREALDWLTLCRFLGWDVGLERGSLAAGPGAARRCVIVARDPANLGQDEVAALASAVASDPLLVVVRCAAPGSPLARLAGAAAIGERAVSGEPRWVGPGPRPEPGSPLRLDVQTVRLSDGCVPWSYVGGAPLAVARQVGRGMVVSLAAHPSAARDAGPAATGMLKRLLVWGSAPPLAWIELEGSFVVRMDDPGSSANVHLRGWEHPELTEGDWLAIAGELERHDARMSTCYVSGWLDDADGARGELEVHGEPIERVPGAVHPAPLVSYRVKSGELAGTLHDYGSEFRGIEALRRAGHGDVEVHGFTHVLPDYRGWASAPDRYENLAWYRELEGFEGAVDGLDPVAEGTEALRRSFGVEPTTLSCPGQACSEAAVESALEAGLRLVAAESLSIREGERFCWSDHVASVAIEFVQPSLLEAGIPVVGLLHDRDVALHGPAWLGERLDEWAAGGARRLIDFRELAATLACRVWIDEGDGSLGVQRPSSPELVRPVQVAFRPSDSEPPSELDARIGETTVRLRVRPGPGGVGTTEVPPPADLRTAAADARGPGR
jgi:hypothetical protein